jgi:hypothetical protein
MVREVLCTSPAHQAHTVRWSASGCRRQWPQIGGQSLKQANRPPRPRLPANLVADALGVLNRPGLDGDSGRSHRWQPDGDLDRRL